MAADRFWAGGGGLLGWVRPGLGGGTLFAAGRGGDLVSFRLGTAPGRGRTVCGGRSGLVCEESAAPMSSPGKKPTILIVDDEERLCKALARSFRHEGYPTRVAACGEEALTVLAAEPVDLVITDLVMPGMSGLALVRALQTTAPGMKVIILTAYGSAESRAEAQALGVGGYLTKPFDLSQLKASVRQLLRGPAAAGVGWGVLAGAAAGRAVGVLAGVPRKVWSCVQPGQVVLTTGQAVGVLAVVCQGVWRRFGETR